MTSKYIGIQTQRTVVFKPPEMTFKEYDKKMLSFRPDLQYWEVVLEEYRPWDKKDKDEDHIYDEYKQKEIDLHVVLIFKVTVGKQKYTLPLIQHMRYGKHYKDYTRIQKHGH